MRRNKTRCTLGCSAEVLEPRRLLSVTFDLTIADDGSHAAYYGPIRSHLLAAAADWGRRFASNASLQIVVRFSPTTLRASGHSVVSHFYRFNGQYNVAEEGAVYELRTGIDPNGADPDIEIFFQDDYLKNEMWFDPDPATRSAPPDPNRVDAYSVCLHELGHALGFNGFKDGSGAVPADYVSRWDEYVVPAGDNLFFTGPAAEAVYGAPVPVTYGLPNHIGNSAPRPGSDLIPDLMNGVVFIHARRYYISNLDFAVVKDVGVPVRPPPAVVGRNVFYNQSAFDGFDGLADLADDGAIAPDKTPLLPGGAASFSNVTSYTRGINGVMFDVSGGLSPSTLSGIAASVALRAGAGGNPATWAAAPRPSQVGIRRGAGAGGSDRITLVWPGGAIKNTWLQVTVRALPPSGLAADDVFYFGNLVGDTGAGPPAEVDGTDVFAVRAARGAAAGPGSRVDLNRDGVVNVLDEAVSRANQQHALPPPLTPPAPAGSAAPFPSFTAPTPHDRRRGGYVALVLGCSGD